MSYHIISIDTPSCQLSVKLGQLQLESSEGNKSIPMEDVGAIIISSLHCNMSKEFILEACRRRIGLIICEQYKPAALVLPVNRITDTNLIRQMMRMPSQLKNRLWEKTLNSKCHNQAELCQQWLPGHPAISHMRSLAVSKKVTREAECAKLFWRVFADSHSVQSFRRGRFEAGYNSLFNYAYAILLSCVLQRMLALGLDPSFGIYHKERPKCTPLAYDLMEPFRPIFDANVSRWIQKGLANGENPESICQINTGYRQHIIATLLARLDYGERCQTLRAVIDAVLLSFRHAVAALQSGPYQPFNYSSIVWAG